MNAELQKLESRLRTLRPGPLDVRLLDRLEIAFENDPSVLSDFQRATETQLQAVEPSPLPPHLIARAETACSRVPYDQSTKVVSFSPVRPPIAPETPQKSPASRRWAIAAAVALCGALTPFLIDPPADSASPVAAKPSAIAPAEPGISRADAPRSPFVPATFSSGVSDASDLGVMWSDNSQPMRVVKVIYTDKATLLNDEGEEVIVEVPRVEYVVVPEKID